MAGHDCETKAPARAQGGVMTLLELLERLLELLEKLERKGQRRLLTKEREGDEDE